MCHILLDSTHYCGTIISNYARIKTNKNKNEIETKFGVCQNQIKYSPQLAIVSGQRVQSLFKKLLMDPKTRPGSFALKS